jgi:hypothetical protein
MLRPVSDIFAGSIREVRASLPPEAAAERRRLAKLRLVYRRFRAEPNRRRSGLWRAFFWCPLGALGSLLMLGWGYPFTPAGLGRAIQEVTEYLARARH